MAEEQASPQEASPAPEAITEASAATGTVIPDQAKADRPVENLAAEFNRKNAKLQQQLDQVLAYLANQQQVRQPSVPKAEVTDDDLWALAQQGDRVAFEEYQRRVAQRVYNQNSGVATRNQTAQNQISALMQKYPMFSDGQHPLTQTANQALTLLVRSGEPAGDPGTVLKAMFTAVAERPDLVSEHYSQTARASEQQRRSAGQVAQSGQTGASHRSSPAPSKDKLKVSPEEEALARRMGVKDPLGAKRRFLERNEKGTSSLGAVGAMVDPEAF